MTYKEIYEKLLNKVEIDLNDCEKSKILKEEFDKFIINDKLDYNYLIDNYKNSCIRKVFSKEYDNKIFEYINNLIIFKELGLLNEDIIQINDLINDIKKLFKESYKKIESLKDDDYTFLKKVKDSLLNYKNNKPVNNLTFIFEYISKLNIDEKEKLDIIYALTSNNIDFYLGKNVKEVKDSNVKEEDNVTFLTAKSIYDKYKNLKDEYKMIYNSYNGVDYDVIPNNIKIKLQIYRIIDSYELLLLSNIEEDKSYIYQSLKDYIDEYDKLLIIESDKKIDINHKLVDDNNIIDINFLSYEDGKTFYELGLENQKLNKNQLERLDTLKERLNKGLKINENYYKVLGSSDFRYVEIKDHDGIKFIIVYLPYNDFKNILIINAGIKEQTLQDAIKIEKKYSELIKEQTSLDDEIKKVGGSLK